MGTKATLTNLSVQTSAEIPPACTFKVNTTIRPTPCSSSSLSNVWPIYGISLSTDIFFLVQASAQVLTTERASELVHLWTAAPSVVTQAHQPTDMHSYFLTLTLHSYHHTQLSKHCMSRPSLMCQMWMTTVTNLQCHMRILLTNLSPLKAHHQMMMLQSRQKWQQRWWWWQRWWT